MLEHGTAIGWRITPLGAPVMSEGKPTIAAWIEVSEAALDNVRRATGFARSLLPLDGGWPRRHPDRPVPA
ncbi:hypothetical protein D3C87_1823740 [compost metagenome]